MIPELAATVVLAATSVVSVPGVGDVAVAAPRDTARAVALLLASPDDASAAEAFAGALAADGVLVVLVDVRAHLAPPRGRCWYPAGRLESLAQDVEKRLGLASYLRPVLVGEGAAASVAWAALAQAPRGTFSGAVLGSLSPGRALPAEPCRASGPALAPGRDGVHAPPAPGAPIAVLGTARDTRCASGPGRAFAAAVPGAPFTDVRAEERCRALAGAVLRLAAIAPAARAPPARVPPPGVPAVDDLPIVEVPPRAAGGRLAVMLSGDGGWVGLDEGVAAALADAGVGVVGLDSLQYFWRRRTPEETARDVGRLVAHFRAAWGRDEVLLVGYSRGADVVPLLPPRLPDEARAVLRGLALLGPGTFAELEVHVVDLFSARRREAAVSTEDAVRALPHGLPVLCVQGRDERDSLCPRVEGRAGVRRVVLPGGHHFDRDYGNLARLILELAP